MPRGIFLIDSENRLAELVETPYQSEDLLQLLLADHPSVLAGDTEDSSERRRWLLVSREAEVPDSGDGAGRWSIDHVFIDQDAVPTLVEVKRSSDTRIRREVVGQMLDYAANAQAYWNPERLKDFHESRCSARGVDPDAALRAALGEAIDPDEHWTRVKTNLSAGRIRLVFVSDEIPAELRRIVEFLNEQMDPAEVIAIEVRQYVGEGLRTLVPTIIGQTAAAEQRKAISTAPRVQWDEERMMVRLAELQGPDAVGVARGILRWAEPRAARIWWGNGKFDGSFVPVVRQGTVDHQLFAVYSSGQVELLFNYYLTKPPFDDESLKQQFISRLNAIPGVSIPADGTRPRPNFPLLRLVESGALQAFLYTFDWFIARVREQPA